MDSDDLNDVDELARSLADHDADDIIYAERRGSRRRGNARVVTW